MKTKQSDYYVYMLKNGAVKCGNPCNKLKFPTLTELYFKCFGKDFENKHNALGDVSATVECFKYLIENQIISL